ncbi:hypothetical protein ACFVT5_00100 [Streptomyces sp. NPDC058001]|uniref:hypothetical protein n=1 Tax=Streptomyces sp. NPDC058001 TaxID=3346300 RepID=UPI0036EDDCCE
MTHVTRLRRHGVPAALLVTLALALAGCGDGGGDTGVASAGGAKKDTSSAKENLDPDQQGIKFAQCLRKQGLDVDDPKPGGGIGIKGNPDKPMSKAEIDKAMEACKKYEPQRTAPDGSGKIPDTMREYAKCMRKEGVEKFPDPKSGGIQLDGSVMKDPDFKNAEKACQSIMGSGGSQHTEKG